MLSKLKTSRAIIIALSAILVAYGFIILRSTTQPLPSGKMFFIKQCIWLCIAIVFCFFFSFINLNKVKNSSLIIGVLTLIILLSVFCPVISRCVKGAHRWIEIFGLRLQPSELAKIGFVLFFAYYLSDYMTNLKDLKKGFLYPIAVVGIFCFLLMIEPDFGTTALFGCVSALLLFIKGVRLRFIIPTFIFALLIFCVAIYFNPVRLRRITAFLDLENNRLTGAYQLWQSLIAFSSGGWTGVGLGQGRQQYFFLPESHTDFIGAILAEELGILHMLIILCCFCLLAYHGLKIVKQQSDPYLFFIGMGSVLFLSIQVFLNLGVITGLLPTKGIAFPFLSYGGSNLITNFCFIGLLINLSRSIYSPINRIKEVL